MTTHKKNKENQQRNQNKTHKVYSVNSRSTNTMTNTIRYTLLTVIQQHIEKETVQKANNRINFYSRSMLHIFYIHQQFLFKKHAKEPTFT